MLDRRVVFVNEQDDFSPVVLLEQLAEELERFAHGFGRRLADEECFIGRPQAVVHVLLAQERKPVVQAGKLPCDVFLHAVPRVPFEVFHR